MSTTLALFLERFAEGRWVTPTGLLPRFPRKRATPLGNLEVCWWPLHWPQTGLFFGDHAVVAMRAGVPGDLSAGLAQRVPASFEGEGTWAGWSLLGDLCLQRWESETVLVEAQVEARLAAQFGAGQRARDELVRELGGDGAVLGSPRRLAGGAQDWEQTRRHELYGIPANQPVAVTWRETIAHFAGRIVWDEGLARLRDAFSSSEYRVVTALG